MYLLLVTDYISNRQFIFDNTPIKVNKENYKMIFHEYVNRIQELHKGFDMYMNITNNECEIYYFREYYPNQSSSSQSSSSNKSDPGLNYYPNTGNYPNVGAYQNAMGTGEFNMSYRGVGSKQIVYILHFIPVLYCYNFETDDNHNDNHNNHNNHNNNTRIPREDPGVADDEKNSNKEFTPEIKKEFVTELEGRLSMPKYGLNK